MHYFNYIFCFCLIYLICNQKIILFIVIDYLAKQAKALVQAVNAKKRLFLMSWLSKKNVLKMKKEDKKEEKAKLEGVEYVRLL